MRPVTETPSRATARLAGAVYLLFFLAAVLGDFFMNRSGVFAVHVVPGDAAATANKILAQEASFRSGFALSLIATACYIAVTVFFYQFFRAVNRTVAFLAAFFSLMGLAIQTFGDLFLLAPVVLLGGRTDLGALTVEQSRALALMFLELQHQAYGIGLVFDGMFLSLLGYLIVRCAFLPRTLGVLTTLAGASWLIFLVPPVAMRLLSYIEALGILAEAALMLWLLVVGVRTRRVGQVASADATAVGAPL